MSKYQPESWRANASQNGLGLPHTLDCGGTSWSGGTVRTMKSARIAETTRNASAQPAIRNASAIRNARSAIRNAQSALRGDRIPYASFRIRVPRLRNALRVPHARGLVAVGPCVQGRGPAEKTVGVRRAVEHARQVVLRSPDAGLRNVRRSARTGGMLPELSVAIFRTHQTSASGRIGDPVAPRSLSGIPTKQNSRWPAAASASRLRFSMM